MKILLIHNFYGSSAPSGENVVFAAEKRLLETAGHQVVELTRNSDELRSRGPWGALRGGLSTPWSIRAFRQVRQLLERDRPAIMHAHNTFPLLSPAVFHAAGRSATPTVLTLHNFRTCCAAAIPMRDGKPCLACLDKRGVLPALRHGCYRQSRLATLPLAASIALHHYLGTWHRQVDAFIALTGFQREVLARAGLPGDRIHVKPNFYPDPPAPICWAAREEKVMFIGRLSEEKGVRFLLEAWQRWGDQAPVLELAGDGPQRRELQHLARPLGDRVRFLGQLPFAAAQSRLAGARMLVLPSVWFEGFPMVIREAFALGVPVAASRLGSMICLISKATGALFAPGDSPDLERCVRALWADQQGLARRAEAARAEFEARYTSAVNYQRLLEIYRAAAEHRRTLGSQTGD